MNRPILGWIAVAVVVLTGPILVVRADDPVGPKEPQARRSLQVLGHALDRYMRYNDNKLPAHLSELYEQGFILDLDAFASPASGATITSSKEIDEKTDYYLTINPTGATPLLLLKEKKGFHGGKALAYYSDRKIRLEGPGFTPKLLERPVVVDIRPKPPGPEPQPPVSSEPVVLQVRVVGEQGGTVRLAAPPDYLPGVGDKVEVFFVIAEPDNLGLIGTGKVTDVADDHLLAKLEQGTGKVTKDHQYLAKVYAARPRKRLRLDRFAGTWEIDDPDASFRLVLRAEGGKVTGIYGRAGQVDGEVKDGKLVLNWRRPDLKRGGSAELALSADAKLLEGTWQHDPKAFDNGLSGGGTWRFRHAAASTTPEPSSPGRDMVQVPAVVGLSAKEAVEAVRKARLLPKAEVHDPPPSQDKAFEVYRTAPAAGTLVARSSEVRLWVYARPDEPDEAEPKPRKPGGTDLSGKWQETSLVWGKSLWTLTAQADGRYRAQQHNLGKVSGTAELTGDMLRLDWKMKDGSHQGFYEWKLSADRASGKGKSVVTKGAVGTYASSIKRVGAGPATEDKDKDTKKP